MTCVPSIFMTHSFNTEEYIAATSAPRGSKLAVGRKLRGLLGGDRPQESWGIIGRARDPPESHISKRVDIEHTPAGPHPAANEST